MKRRMIVAGMIVGLALSAMTTNVLAQNGPRGKGKGAGYGGPPQSEQERAARQATCLTLNGGVCPNGGPRSACTGQGKGNGKGARQGLRDGTGPRSANGTCPLNQGQPKQ